LKCAAPQIANLRQHLARLSTDHIQYKAIDMHRWGIGPEILDPLKDRMRLRNGSREPEALGQP
jgi:hypothetical protein